MGTTTRSRSTTVAGHGIQRYCISRLSPRIRPWHRARTTWCWLLLAEAPATPTDSKHNGHIQGMRSDVVVSTTPSILARWDSRGTPSIGWEGDRTRGARGSTGEFAHLRVQLVNNNTRRSVLHLSAGLSREIAAVPCCCVVASQLIEPDPRLYCRVLCCAAISSVLDASLHAPFGMCRRIISRGHTGRKANPRLFSCFCFDISIFHLFSAVLALLFITQ